MLASMRAWEACWARIRYRRHKMTDGRARAISIGLIGDHQGQGDGQAHLQQVGGDRLAVAEQVAEPGFPVSEPDGDQQ